MQRLRTSLVGFIVIAAIAGCSIFERYEPTPAVQQTVLRLAIDYLGRIVDPTPLNQRSLAESILWIDYIQASRGGISKSEYFRQIELLSKQYSRDDHPLTRLEIVSIDVERNSARVTFKKANQPDTDEFWVSMAWVGRGWLIDGDSIFRPGGYLATLKQRPADKA